MCENTDQKNSEYGHFSRDLFDCFRYYFGVDYTYQSSFVSYGKLIESS